MLCSLSQGPSGIWCDIDVVEFTYYGVPAIAPKEQIFTELVDGLRGMDACIGSGTQVNSMVFQVPLIFFLSVRFDEDYCNIVESIIHILILQKILVSWTFWCQSPAVHVYFQKTGA